ncbi:MAG: hypothetical protein VKL41_10250 [Snowella sp.]|nr:hypothetical protein [Snowella sp.]
MVETFWKQFDNLALIRFLSQFLQHPYADFRDRTIYVLSKHQEHLDEKSTFILKALLYDFTKSSQWIKLKDRFSLLIAQPAIPTTIKTKAETLKFLFDPFEKKILNTITLDQIDVYISATEEDQEYIESLFSNAIFSCESEATTVINLFSSEKDNHLLAVLNHLLILIDKREAISNTRSTLIEKQERLNAMWQEIKKDDIEVYNSSKTYQYKSRSLPETYDDCVKKECEKYLNAVEKEIQSLQEVIQCRKKLRESRQQLGRKMPEIKYKDGEFHQYILASKIYQDLMFSSLPMTCEQCTKLEESLNNFKKELETLIDLREVCQHNESLIVELLKRMKYPPLRGSSNKWKLNLPNPLTYQKGLDYNQQLNSLRDKLHSSLQSDISEITQKFNDLNRDIKEKKDGLENITNILVWVGIIIIPLAVWQIMANVVGVFLFKIVCAVIFFCSASFILYYILQSIRENHERDRKKSKDQLVELTQKRQQAQKLQNNINHFLSQWKTWIPH